MSVSVKDAAAKLKSLKTLQSEVEDAIKKAKSNPVIKAQLDKKLVEIKSEIVKYQKLGKSVTKGSFFVKIIKKVKQVVSKADLYIDRFKILFLNKKVEKELVKFKISSPRFVWGIVSVGASFDQSTKISFGGSITKQGILVSGHAASQTSLSGDLQLGFVYKKFKTGVKGILTGTLLASTQYKGYLSLKGANLNGNLDLGALVGNFGITATLEIPALFVKAWNFINRKNKIKETMSKGLGSWELFIIYLPAVNVVFSISSGKFISSKAVGFRVVAGKDAKNIGSSLRKIILK